MVDMFNSILQGQYYTRCSTFDTFAEMVTYGERIEIGIKLGKIQDVSGINDGSAKKFLVVSKRRKRVNLVHYMHKKGKVDIRGQIIRLLL